MTNSEAIDLLDNLLGVIEDNHGSDYDKAIHKAIDALKGQQWIPVKTRPMTTKERDYFENIWDADLSDDEAVIFDCPMPEDKQEIWLSTKNGIVFWDTCENDDGYIGLEGNGDWYDIAAWMPIFKPEPYREGE